MALNPTSQFWPQWHENKLFALLLAILLVYGIVYTGAATRKILLETQHVGFNDRDKSTISVTATGEATVVNDITKVTLGVVTSAVNAKEASSKNNETVSAIVEGIKALGISDLDIQTSSYTVYPTYTYTGGESTISGYEANQSITVKIREKDLQEKVLQTAEELGANQIGGLQFDAEDDSAALAAAREAAITKAYAQAKSIARAMGTRVGAVVHYSETQGGGNYPYPMMVMDSTKAMGMGGEVSAPTIEAGQNEVQVSVYIDFTLE